MYKATNKKYLKKYRQKLRTRPSKAEDVFWAYVRKERLGVKIRRQHSIGNYILDFYVPECKLNIEIDGEQHDETIDEDDIRDKYLSDLGIEVIRYASLEVLNELEGILENLEIIIENKKG